MPHPLLLHGRFLGAGYQPLFVLGLEGGSGFAGAGFLLGKVALPFLEVVGGGGDDYGCDGSYFVFGFGFACPAAEEPSAFKDGEGGDGVTEDSEVGDVAASMPRGMTTARQAR